MPDNTIPGKGAIVGCRFPVLDRDKNPGPKVRPCLVIGTFDQKGIPYCCVAYGTDASRHSNFGYVIDITDPDDLESARLTKPTRFVLGRMRVLPYGREFFSFGQHNSAVFGWISPESRDRLDRLVANIVRQDPDLRGLMRDDATFPTERGANQRRPHPRPAQGGDDTLLKNTSAILEARYNGRAADHLPTGNNKTRNGGPTVAVEKRRLGVHRRPVRQGTRPNEDIEA